MTDDDDIEDVIAELAELILREGLSDAVRQKAEQASAAIGLEDITGIQDLFHYPPPEPQGYDVATHGLGGWLSACQFAAFELTYNIGEPALPFVRKIAWGPYDWTQGNAIELLIRFAADGVCREELIEEIKALFPDIRYEAQLYALEPLIPRLETDKGLKSVVDRLVECVAFDEVYKELTDRK